MKQMGLLILLAALLTGCGAVTDDPGDGTMPGLEPAPPIRATNRAAPDAFTEWNAPTNGVVVTTSYCVAPVGEELDEDDECEVGGKTWENPCSADPPTEQSKTECKAQLEQMEQIREEANRWLERVAPAPGTEPRIVAELDLPGAAQAELVTWRTENGKLCLLARIQPSEQADLAAGLEGECVPYVACKRVCLTLVQTTGRQIVLAGAVAKTADALRLSAGAGLEATYPLVGPVIDSSTQRVFMLALGPEDWRRLELLRGDEVYAVDQDFPDGLRGLRCATESLREFQDCVGHGPLDMGEPEPVQSDEEVPAPDCERQFDENDAGFQLCGEGESQDTE